MNARNWKLYLTGSKEDHLDHSAAVGIKWVRIKSYTILGDLSSATLEARSVFTEYDFE